MVLNGLSKQHSNSGGGGNYPVYEGSGAFKAQGAASSIVIEYPTTVNEDDIVIIQLSISGTGSFTTPSGWSVINNNNTSQMPTLSIWKRASGTEGGSSVSVATSTFSTATCGIMYRFSGCISTGTPFDYIVTLGLGSRSVTSINYTNIDNTYNGLGVALFHQDDNVGWTNTGTDGYTEASNQQTGVSSDLRIALQIKDVDLNTTAGEAEYTATANDNTVATSILLKQEL